MAGDGNVLPLAGVASMVKLLLIPAYRSTDFEVHRNWLAITHSLPLNKWYVEATSEWTLDYPPLFAWFEWFLSLFAQFVDPQMLVVSNLAYASDATVIFQRLSVILTDFVYFYAIREFAADISTNRKNQSIIPLLLIFNAGLFLVDHIHFQYNGMLYGFLLLSIARIIQGRYMEGAFWFSLLLNMKHIFLYFAPAFFVHLLRSHCFQANRPISPGRFSMKNFLSLGSVVVFICVLSLGPFLYMGQAEQLLSRLFPFKRGLVHAYWAPNFWALYSGVDKVLTALSARAGLVDGATLPTAAMTGGMVQEYKHIVLPSIPPIATLVLTVLSLIPALVMLWQKPSGRSFLRALILCGFSSFLFGWHVHEKAVLMIMIPMTLLVLHSPTDARVFLVLYVTGCYSLFPLVFSPLENLLMVVMLLGSCIVSFQTLSLHYSTNYTDEIPEDRKAWWTLPLLDTRETAYLIGLIPLGLFSPLIMWPLGLDRRFPFLPLMLTSLYCSPGIFYSWLRFYNLFFQEWVEGRESGSGVTVDLRSKNGGKGKKKRP